MQWLEKNIDSLPIWIKKSSCPMLASMPDGDILWCNEAFEDLLDYTVLEIVKKKWTDLTVETEDRDADLAMAKTLVEGRRQSYHFQKSYKRKTGTPVPVIIHVLRFPQEGEFQFFLVTAIPVDKAYEHALGQIAEVREIVLELATRNNFLPFWDSISHTVSRLFNWAEKNPYKAFIGVVFLVFIFQGGNPLDFLNALREWVAKLGAP